MSRNISIFWLAVVPGLVTFLVAAGAIAGSLNIPHSFSTGQIASSNDMNTNFLEVKKEIDDNDGRITAIEGKIANGGTILAAAAIRGGLSPSVMRQYSNLPGAPAITVTRTAMGRYLVDFGANISNRFFSAMVGRATSSPLLFGGEVVVQPDTNVNRLRVWLSDSAGFWVDDRDFFIQVH